MAEGALCAYAMYLSQPYQNAATAPWTFLLVLEYRDMKALAESDIVKGKVREQLAADPAWKSFSEGRVAMRKAKGFVFADAIVAPAP